MSYEMMLYILLAFIAGRISKTKIYIGYDEDLYNKADIAILRK